MFMLESKNIILEVYFNLSDIIYLWTYFCGFLNKNNLEII